ncbi:MAG: hypothetical protein Fur0018_01550 [Anaerolineales bacterium]
MKTLKGVWFSAALLGVLLVLMGAVTPVGARQILDVSPQDLIAAVNHLRQVNGLPAYQVNQALMQAAQAQADWQAANNTVTHTGQGGTRPKDRAAAAGYGGQFVSENIAGGYQMSLDAVISMWQGDDLHLNTMLGPNYQDVGAGVAASGDTVYYVLLAGYGAGGSATAPTETAAPAATGEAGSSPGGAIITSTPNADGSVVHIVQPGDTPWGIAVAYKISIAQLMSQNGLPANVVLYPGERLIVHRAGELTPVPTATPAPPTPTPTPTGPILPTATPAWMGTPGTVVVTLPPPPTLAPLRPAGDSGAMAVQNALGIGLLALVAIAALQLLARRTK